MMKESIRKFGCDPAGTENLPIDILSTAIDENKNAPGTGVHHSHL
jgi:hypothetical protein